MNEIKAKDGYYLTNKDRTVFYKAIKGMNVKSEDYEQISEEEAKTKAQEGNFKDEDFEENFEALFANLPTGVKYGFSLDEHDAKEWAYNEAMYGE